MDNLTNNNYKGHLFQVIDIDISDMIDLDEVVLLLSTLSKIRHEEIFEIIELSAVTQRKLVSQVVIRNY